MSAAAQPDLSKLPNVLPANLPDVLPADGAPVASSVTPKPQFPITPQPGESLADTMKRAVEAGRSVTPAQIKTSEKEGIKKVPSVLLASLLAGPTVLGLTAGPDVLGAAAGGGIPGGITSGASGSAGMEAVKKGLHAAAGENVFTPQSAKDIGEAALEGGAFGGAMGLFGKVANSLLTSKLSRGMVNESLGATSRDVTYGNPAKALLDEGISSPITGDIEEYKAALRSGASPEQALMAAGGRTAGVAKKITELSPQVDQILSKSTAQIPVADVIDRPLMHAATTIIDNPAMTQAEKDAALTQIGALQQSLKEGLSDTISPLQANKIKQAIGSRINWAGNIAVTDEVRPAYRAVFGALKESVNKAVPDVATVNERLTNLLAAQTDLEKLMKAEEVGQGKGALGSAVTGIARRAEAVSGRFIPGAASASRAVTRPVSVGAAAGLFQLPTFASLRNMPGNQ